MVISPTELSAKAGISLSYASMLLNDDILKRRHPSLRTALNIYDKTGLQLGSLTGLRPDEIEPLRRIVVD